MFTKVTDISELVQIISEEFFNKTNKVTKISDESVLNGEFYGMGKVGQKAMKDIAIIESHILPESAYGPWLDIIANRLGISSRFPSSESSGYLRLVADPGTTYLFNVHTFSSISGISFQLDSDITVPQEGWIYAKVRSQDKGEKANVSPFTVINISSIPSGHKYVTNEAYMSGGREDEDDKLFLQRIKEGPNALAKSTLSYLEQIFQKINPNILRVFYQGTNSLGKNVLKVCSQNGIDFTQTELDQLLDGCKEWISITDLKPYAENYIGIKIENIEWFPIDISMRVDISAGVNPDDWRKEVQFKILKYLDFRFWNNNKKVEWDDLLVLSKETRGLKYLADQYFFPRLDMIVPKNKLPRLRGFLLLDLNGNIIADLNGKLSPIYYPNQKDFSFWQTVLSTI